MNRIVSALALSALLCFAVATTFVSAGETTGVYMEARTCQVYTGPCFANGEVGLTGKDAVMAWKITDGKRDNVDLAGLSVVVVLNSSNTLGFRGMENSKEIKSVIFVDDKANKQQRAALVEFAREHSGRAGKRVVRIDSAPINMSLDTAELRGSLDAGKALKLRTRKTRAGDCICGNEVGYYPPLAKVENFATGVSIEGKFNGRGLGSRWSVPGSRSAYMATFAY